MTAGACTADIAPLLGHSANYFQVVHGQGMTVKNLRLS